MDWLGPWALSTLPEAAAEFRTHLTPEALAAFEERASTSSLPQRQTGGPSPEQALSILLDLRDAFDGTDAFIAAREALSASYVRHVHSRVTRNIGIAGALDRSPGELENLIEACNGVDAGGVPAKRRWWISLNQRSTVG